MDSLGERLTRDRARADALIEEAKEHERQARQKWGEAHEIERLMELARIQK